MRANDAMQLEITCGVHIIDGRIFNLLHPIQNAARFFQFDHQEFEQRKTVNFNHRCAFFARIRTNGMHIAQTLTYYVYE